jgi:hypothetical protein
MENNYRVNGESRQQGAIGIFEQFIDIVNADTSKQAYDITRESQYKQNREHVLIKSIELITDSGYVIVEPRAYLDY